MDESTQFGIVEMGANHPGEIKTLCDIADPDYGIITNVGQAHLEGFGSYENIIATKKQLYDHIRAKNGKLFVNAGDSLLLELSEGIERSTYGQNGNALKGEIKQSIPFLVYALNTLKGDLYVRTHLIGGYNFENAMAASCLDFIVSPELPEIFKGSLHAAGIGVVCVQDDCIPGRFYQLGTQVRRLIGFDGFLNLQRWDAHFHAETSPPKNNCMTTSGLKTANCLSMPGTPCCWNCQKE